MQQARWLFSHKLHLLNWLKRKIAVFWGFFTIELIKEDYQVKNVMILSGAGQIGMAIARRMGYGMKIVIGDKKHENAQAISATMN